MTPGILAKSSISLLGYHVLRIDSNPGTPARIEVYQTHARVALWQDFYQPGGEPEFVAVPFDHPLYIYALARSVEQAYAGKNIRALFHDGDLTIALETPLSKQQAVEEYAATIVAAPRLCPDIIADCRHYLPRLSRKGIL